MTRVFGMSMRRNFCAIAQGAVPAPLNAALILGGLLLLIRP
jgi:hypothetical protein